MHKQAEPPAEGRAYHPWEIRGLQVDPAKDRDNEVVLPDGGIYDDYEMLRVVLFGHNYSGLGIGKNLWLKNDDQLFSVLARTQYTTAKANPLGEQVYNYRLEEMPLGESIGFVPIEWITPDDKAWGKTFDRWLDRYKQFMNLHQRNIPDDVDLSRIFTLWIMLEYSDVIIPSNPFAIGSAVEKGLISEKDADRYIIKTQPDEEAEFVVVFTSKLESENGAYLANVPTARRDNQHYLIGFPPGRYDFKVSVIGNNISIRPLKLRLCLTENGNATWSSLVVHECSLKRKIMEGR